VPRTRTTKKLAQRIDLNYFQKPRPFRRWRFWLSVAAPLAAIVWLGWHGLRGDPRVYSAGQLSRAHAVFANKCSACHVTRAGLFSERTSDSACLACHDGAIHHASQTFTPSCAACHSDHRGAIRLAEVSEESCTQCHANLETRDGPAHYFTHIHSFNDDHPEFAVLRSGQPDRGTIKVNHYLHLQPNLTGPNGRVQLVCADCHRPAGSTEPWRFGSGAATAAPPPAASNESAGMPPAFTQAAPAAYMAPATYAQTCSGCHLLTFDKRFSDQVPHDTPEKIHAFVLAKFQTYIATHPADLRELRDPNRDLPEKPVAADYRVLTPPQWVAEHTAQAEDLLWRKTCKQCHTLNFSQAVAPAPNNPAPLPAVAPSNVTTRYMPDAKFDHSQHRLVSCESCHAATRTSQQNADILLPGIATCRTCHNAGTQSAESRCFECHTYHGPASLRIPFPRPPFDIPANAQNGNRDLDENQWPLE